MAQCAQVSAFLVHFTRTSDVITSTFNCIALLHDAYKLALCWCSLLVPATGGPSQQAIAAVFPESPVNTTPMSATFWDEKYGKAGRVWSGSPNPHLVSTIASLSAGRALDVGAGEGADAIWLAKKEWTVIAVDISGVALERGRSAASDCGAAVSSRITWKKCDILSEPLPPGPFDLVALHFMHLKEEERKPLFERSFAVVAPGGTLMIVAHHPSDLETTVMRPKIPELFYTADEITAMLDESWTVLVCDKRPRNGKDADGNVVTIHDTVLIARRSM